jgi:hypothetical protein
MQKLFSPGFRLSVLDVLVLIAGTVTTLILVSDVGWLGLLILFVLGHFFLFCNVIRLSRPLELLWAGVFVALASATLALETPGWFYTVLLSLLITVVVVVMEMRKPSYHGLGWQWINPDLPTWWKSRSVSGGG